MTSKLTVPYACALEVIHRTRSGTPGRTALDLACGPGHFTLGLARYLGYDSVLGIDLSAGMVEAARQNAAATGLSDRTQFITGDVMRLEGIGDGTMALTCFTFAAHHLPDLAAVSQVVRQMDRITQSNGLILILDLVRLGTAHLTERYVETVAGDYRPMGLPQLLHDFRNSLYAAWSGPELRRAIPEQSARPWCHVVPRGLPMLQILLGLPQGRTKPLVRRGAPWPQGRGPVPDGMVPEWQLLSWALRFASWRVLPPARSHSRPLLAAKAHGGHSVLQGLQVPERDQFSEHVRDHVHC
jgi:ubiquinone/menaquinone biosynthesis C-methylase UbiE